MSTDERGLSLTGATDTEALEYCSILQDYFTYRQTTFPRLEELCVLAPEFVMSHIFKGYLLLSIGSQSMLAAAEECYRIASNQRDSMDVYERHHLDALDAWCKRDVRKAITALDAATFNEPMDLLALKIQHSLLFSTGNTEHMRDAAARALSGWHKDVPGHAHVQGMMAFALEETGHYSSAERMGKSAAEQCPDDLWAVHAVSHVFEMQGRLNEGIAWLDRPYDHWDDKNPFRGHLWWHAALFAFDRGAYDRVLDLYDRAIKPEGTAFYLDIQNMVSLLTRLEFAGVDPGNRWDALSNLVEERHCDHGVMFTEPHHTIALGRTGKQDKIQAQIGSLTKLAEHSTEDRADHIQTLVNPLCRSIDSYYKGDYSVATEQFMNLRYEQLPLGGSHAQRDLFSMLLVDSSIRAKQYNLARALLTERVTRHPNSYSSWKHYADICQKLGDSATSEYATAQVKRIANSA